MLIHLLKISEGSENDMSNLDPSFIIQRLNEIKGRSKLEEKTFIVKN